MKRRFLSFFLLFLFSLSNAGVVLGLHTCLKSQKTDFSVFPIQNQACCSSVEAENESKVASCRMSSGEARSLSLNSGPSNCCQKERPTQGRYMVDASGENALCAKDGVDGKLNCCGLGIENKACTGGDCCRVEQVVLLDMHPRSVPETRIAIELGILQVLSHLIFQSYSSFPTANQAASILGTPLGLSARASEVLQVWRL